MTDGATTPTADEAEIVYDVFVAHASADVDAAVRLYELLTEGGCRVFVDARSLQPGDLWDDELPKAQRQSDMTVVMLSSAVDNAWYGREEIAEAIELARNDARRVVPLYLEEVDKPPYGLRRVQALWAVDDAGLVEASRRLLSLVRPDAPTDEPGHRTRLFNVVPPVSRWMTGRGDLVAALEDGVTEDGVTVRALVGMGGVGKTTVASACALAAHDRCGVVWWVGAEEPTTLVSDLAALADAADLPAGDDGELAARARDAVTWLGTTSERWLIVFDNVLKPADVEAWIPDGGTGEVLLTSRYRHVDQLAAVTAVDEFDTELATEFLRSRVREKDPRAADDEAGARRVAMRLEGLPLALEQAAAYVARNPNRTWASFLGRADEVKAAYESVQLPRGYKETAFTTWGVSIDAAAAESALAPKILEVLSFYAAEAFPIDAMLGDAAATDPYFDAEASELEQAIDVLYAYSLLQVQPGEVRLHRVVQDATRADGGDASRLCSYRLLAAAVPDKATEPDSWPEAARLHPHVLAAFDPDGDYSADDAILLRNAVDRTATYLQFSGKIHDAVPLFRDALAVVELALGDEHPDTLTARGNLASSYWSAGRTAEAIELDEVLLADRVRLLGSEHPDTMMSRAALAASYWSAGRTAEAIELGEVVLADRVRLLGGEHPDTLTARGNLASSYQSAGRTAEAIELEEVVLADCVRVLGGEHPDTLIARANLAVSYQSAGRTAEAIELGEVVLADRVRLLGGEHPATLMSRANVAASYWSAGRTAEAIELGEATLAARVRVLGDEHPDTVSFRERLEGWRVEM